MIAHATRPQVRETDSNACHGESCALKLRKAEILESCGRAAVVSAAAPVHKVGNFDGWVRSRMGESRTVGTRSKAGNPGASMPSRNRHLGKLCADGKNRGQGFPALQSMAHAVVAAIATAARGHVVARINCERRRDGSEEETPQHRDGSRTMCAPLQKCLRLQVSRPMCSRQPRLARIANGSLDGFGEPVDVFRQRNVQHELPVIICPYQSDIFQGLHRTFACAPLP